MKILFKTCIIMLIVVFLYSFNVLGYQANIKYYGNKYRDPFKSLIPKDPKGNKKITSFEVNVEGIIWATDKPSAIIDGNVLNVGDTVSGAKIVEISKKGIVFSLGGEQFIVGVK